MIKRIFFVILPIITLVVLLLISHNLGYECIFRKYLDIRCAGCGLTRSFYSLMHFKILDCIYYNILTFPLLGLLVYYEYLAIRDIVLKRDELFKKFAHFLAKGAYVIFILFLLAILINNVHQI